jgi:DNA-binding PadR family transcriptional regulator
MKEGAFQMKKETYIAEFEELVLLAILKLGSNAYGATIHEALEDTGRKVTVGALYTTLSRLEGKGLIASWMGEPTIERGGRAKKYFKVLATGARALRTAESARRQLLPTFAFGGVQ